MQAPRIGLKIFFQAYLKPKASEKELVLHSRIASLSVVVLGLLFSLQLKSINEIWGWLSLGLGAGLAIPLVMRWFWWRFNGFGFAAGTLFGMIAAVVSKLMLPDAPEYISFAIPSFSSLIGCIIGTFSTKQTDNAVLENFYKITKPFGPLVSYPKIGKEGSA